MKKNLLKLSYYMHTSTYEYYYTVNTYSIRYDIPYTYKIEDYNRLIYMNISSS